MVFVVYEVVCSDLIVPVEDFASYEEASAYVACEVEDGASPDRYEIREESSVPDYDSV